MAFLLYKLTAVCARFEEAIVFTGLHQRLLMLRRRSLVHWTNRCLRCLQVMNWQFYSENMLWPLRTYHCLAAWNFQELPSPTINEQRRLPRDDLFSLVTPANLKIADNEACSAFQAPFTASIRELCVYISIQPQLSTWALFLTLPTFAFDRSGKTMPSAFHLHWMMKR